ncbi:Short chain dehydrogenase atnD [Paramyrothecium foliicola]|nr:Short chain dehydrogenase atnD [Paramyrothecium foliicola]
MDPVSAVGLVGSVVGIADVIAKSVRGLLDLQSRYKSADLKVSTLIGQLSILKAALGHLGEMVNGNSMAQYGQLFEDLSVSLFGCEAMIKALDDRLSHLQRDETNELTVFSKMGLVWDDATMTEYLGILHNQIQALQLLLTALQCRNIFEQSRLLQEVDSRQVFLRVKDDTSSLLRLHDTSSRITDRTESTQNLDTLVVGFEFDQEIITSKVYREAMLSNMVTAIQSKARRAHLNTKLSSNPLTTLKALRTGRQPPHADTSTEAMLRQPSASSLTQMGQPHHQANTGWRPTNVDLDTDSLKRAAPVTEPTPIDQRPSHARSNSESALVSQSTPTPTQTSQQVSHSRVKSETWFKPPSASDPIQISTERSSHVQTDDDINPSFCASALTNPPNQFVIPRDRFHPSFGTRFSKDGQYPSNAAAKVKAAIQDALLSDAFASRLPERRVPAANQIGLSPDWASKDAMNVVILGTSQSGKSTLVKSLAAAFGVYNIQFRRSYRSIVRAAIEDIFCGMSNHIRTFIHQRQVEGTSIFTFETLALFRKVCGPEIYRAITSGSQTKPNPSIANGSARYFWHSLDRICTQGYVPSINDLLRVYVQTTGVFVSRFEVGYRSYNFFDCGGTIPERRLKWKNMFESRNQTLVFTFDVACSAETKTEGGGHMINLMTEQLITWDWIVKSRQFKTIIVLFTKIDLLKAKSISQLWDTGYFPEEKGQPETVDEVLHVVATRLLAPTAEELIEGSEPRVIFLRASITNRVTQPAEEVLIALESLREESSSSSSYVPILCMVLGQIDAGFTVPTLQFQSTTSLQIWNQQPCIEILCRSVLTIPPPQPYATDLPNLLRTDLIPIVEAMAPAADPVDNLRRDLLIDFHLEDCRGRTFIITGSNSGIGYECVKQLVRLDAAHIIMAVRNLESGESARATIETATDRYGVLQVWHLDLASFESVKKFVKKVENDLDQVDVLICNAAMMTSKWDVKEGMESSLTVNLVSNMLLTTMMLPVMASKDNGLDPKPRIVHVGTSTGFPVLGPILQSINKDDILLDLNNQNKWGPQMASRYMLSKALQHFAVRQLATRGPVSDTGIVVNIVDPGLCKTKLARNASVWTRMKTSFSQALQGRTAEVGSRALLAGIAALEESHGKILMNNEVAESKIPEWMSNEEGQSFQEQLWNEIAEKLETIQPGCLECPPE